MLDQLDREYMPTHVGIIMDGNGRWAKKRMMPRNFGHKQGVETLKKITEECSNLGIKYLTVYAFSTENWKRSGLEISGIMNLLVDYLAKELRNLHEKNVKLMTIIKNVSYTLMPLIFSSIEKIDIISNAMILRGFGKRKKRTWYQARKMKVADIVAIIVTAIFVVTSIVLVKVNGGRFYNPFV